jgi:hypothetical protein
MADDIQELNALVKDYGKEFQSPDPRRGPSLMSAYLDNDVPLADWRKIVQSSLESTGRPAHEKFYIMSALKKAAHKFGILDSESNTRDTITEDILSPDEIQSYARLAKHVLSRTDSDDGVNFPDHTIGYDDYDKTSTEDLKYAAGRGNVSEDKDYYYIEDVYDFNKDHFKFGKGVPSGLKALYHHLLSTKDDPFPKLTGERGVASSLVPILQFSESDERAPNIRLRIPKIVEEHKSGGSIVERSNKYVPRAI